MSGRRKAGRKGRGKKIPGTLSGQVCPELLPGLYVVFLTRYAEVRRHDHAHKGLFACLGERRMRIKETEAGVAACQEK